MPYRFRQHEPALKGIRRIAREEIDRAIKVLEDRTKSREVRVHEARKACKKIRAIIRLARREFERNDSYKSENRWYRNTARELASLRDADASRECIERLRDNIPAHADVRRALETLEQRLDDHRPDPARAPGTNGARPSTRSPEELIAAARDRLFAGRRRVAQWSFEREGFAILGPGFRRSYREAKRAMKDAQRKPTPERFHEWRKRVKDHRYHLEALRGPWKIVTSAKPGVIKQLTDALGEHHDLEVLRAEPALKSLRDSDRCLILDLLEREETRLESLATSLGRRAFGRRAKLLTTDLARAWRRWQRGKSRMTITSTR